MIGSVFFNKTFFLCCSLLLVTIYTSSRLHAEEPLGIDVVKELGNCKQINTNPERLACFDHVAIRFSPPLYKGRLSEVTDVITIDKPHRLRYRSYGVIFVLYLRDADGNVLQNLHIGGTGEDSYLIEEPGDYTLKIQGSDSWEIWLEPEQPTSEPSE